VVEKNVQDSRRRIWQDAGTVRFGSFAELNAWLESRCQALWMELLSARIQYYPGVRVDGLPRVDGRCHSAACV